MIEALCLGIFILAAGSCFVFLWNLLLFRRAPIDAHGASNGPSVSVLIPARDEAERIEETLRAVLRNDASEFEVIVLDDHSQDATREIVERLATEDPRVRVVPGETLPAGWCGKQFACFQLSRHARFDEWLFIDADVRLSSDAIGRCVAMRQRTKVDLLSAFPRQRVESFGEAMLIPLIHIILLTYLPLILMRYSRLASASAGCGQLFLTTRAAYEHTGGHGAIRSSLHDGVQLPRVFRRAGCATDFFDGRDLATCRMYDSGKAAWRGLKKNAHEGFAKWPVIVPATVLMLGGYVAPLPLTCWLFATGGPTSWFWASCVATTLAWTPRILTAWRFDRAWRSVPFFPVSVASFVCLQWLAWLQTARGKQAEWRGRSYPVASVEGQ